MNSASNIIGR